MPETDTAAMAAAYDRTEPLLTGQAAMMLLNGAAEAVQTHVPHQPWSRHGNRPVPLQITYDGEADQPWAVRYVATLRGGQRVWRSATGASLAEALHSARQAQTADYPQRLIDVLADDTMPEPKETDR